MENTEATDPVAEPVTAQAPMDAGDVERFNVPVVFASANDTARTIDAVWYTGASVPRTDWMTGEPYDLILDMQGCAWGA